MPLEKVGLISTHSSGQCCLCNVMKPTFGEHFSTPIADMQFNGKIFGFQRKVCVEHDRVNKCLPSGGTKIYYLPLDPKDGFPMVFSDAKVSWYHLCAFRL
jgi:hypothetical protein